MQEIVLKRLATVTSAEALDQVNETYPESEILSFRKIKEAGNDNEFFIVRLRTAAMADESDDVVLDSEDIVIEDKQHEDKEEEKMNEIIRLLKELVEKDSPKETDTTDDLSDEDHQTKPLPTPQKPPMGVAGVGSNITPVSTVVEREANIPKTLARLELIREFGSDYSIGEIEQVNSLYRVALHKKSVTEQDEAAFEDDMAERLEAEQQRQRQEAEYRAWVTEQQKAIDENLRAPARSIYETKEFQSLGIEAKRWIQVMDEAGATNAAIMNEINDLLEVGGEEQGRRVRRRFKQWRAYGQGYEPDEATGALRTHPLRRDVAKALSTMRQEVYAQMAYADAEGQEADETFARKRLKQIEDLENMLTRTDPTQQVDLLRSEVGEEKPRMDLRSIRKNLADIAQGVPSAANVYKPERQGPIKPKRKAPKQKSPYPPGSYGEYIFNQVGPGRGAYDKKAWEKERKEYMENPEEFEKGWKTGVA